MPLTHISRRTATAAAVAGAAILFFPAAAHAAVTVGEPGSAGTGSPSMTNEMCGTAYVGNFKLGTPPEDASAVAGLAVTIALLDASGTEINASTVTTGPDGVFCSSGSDQQQTVMLNGGRTRLSVDQSAVDAYNATTDQEIRFNRVLGDRRRQDRRPHADHQHLRPKHQRQQRLIPR